MSATTPVTAGAAIEVPSHEAYAPGKSVEESGTDERIASPGAEMSGLSS